MPYGNNNVHTRAELFGKHKTDAGQTRVNVSPEGNLATDSYLVDTNGERLTVDTITRSLTTITYPHHEIHAGSHYYIQGFVTLGLNATLYVKLVAPDTAKWCHFLWDIQSTDVLETNLYEGASGGMAGGTAVTPINNNRNSLNVSGMVITSGVTVATTLGLNIAPFKSGTKQTGAAHGREDEIMLKQDTVYLREFISGANANIISFKAYWYEHENKV